MNLCNSNVFKLLINKIDSSFESFKLFLFIICFCICLLDGERFFVIIFGYMFMINDFILIINLCLLELCYCVSFFFVMKVIEVCVIWVLERGVSYFGEEEF